MARRRLSAGLPPNFRYPLITPDNERESFIDHDFYGDGLGQMRDTGLYPTHQPRERSPTPQLVRVAKQPEMIRRQSVRPFSGDWVTPDVVSGSKLPGSFQDTDADDIVPEIVETTPLNDADAMDLYSEESDENLDFGPDEPLVFPQLPLEEVVLEVAYILRKQSKPPVEGFTYVFSDLTGRSKFYRIGSTKSNARRANEHRNVCSLSYFRVQKTPATSLWQYKRLEKLAQAELINMRYEPNCACNSQYHQYLWGKEQTAFEILESWSKWLAYHSPYDKTGHLLPFWEHRLRVFEAGFQHYFDCKGTRCMKHTTDTVACPICLRAGWKAFTTPSGLDKIEFASQTQVAAQWAHKILLYLQKYVSINDSVLFPLLNGVERAASLSTTMSDRLKSPALFLNLLYARLIIPMLWSTIFTTDAYFSILSLLEITIFSVMYMLVRLELAQIAPRRRGKEKKNKEGRLVRRKPLPSSSDFFDDEPSGTIPAVEPRILDIADDPAPNMLRQTKPSGKESGKKPKPVSMLLPGEAATRSKRSKPGKRKSDFV